MDSFDTVLEHIIGDNEKINQIYAEDCDIKKKHSLFQNASFKNST